jgi:hypothetical protein
MAKAAARRAPVTARAIVQRINRKLGGEDAPKPWNHGPYKVVYLRGAAAEEFGKWVVVPTPNWADEVGHGPAGPLSRIEKDHVDLEDFGREIGVLRPWEAVVGG